MNKVKELYGYIDNTLSLYNSLIFDKKILSFYILPFWFEYKTTALSYQCWESLYSIYIKSFDKEKFFSTI
jgi:hypothetical protein